MTLEASSRLTDFPFNAHLKQLCSGLAVARFIVNSPHILRFKSWQALFYLSENFLIILGYYRVNFVAPHSR